MDSCRPRPMRHRSSAGMQCRILGTCRNIID
jgi:hypothetical protein